LTPCFAVSLKTQGEKYDEEKNNFVDTRYVHLSFICNGNTRERASERSGAVRSLYDDRGKN
jgi:hypothetical protein